MIVPIALSLLLLFGIPVCASEGASQPPSLSDMAAHMLMVGFRDSEVDESSPIVRQIANGHVYNVILFDVDVSGGNGERNIRSPEQLSRLVSSLKEASDQPVWVTVDQEGGKVQRLTPERGFAKRYPSAKELGRLGSEAAYETGKEIGEELQRYGFALDFAPVVDLDRNADSPAIGRKERSFGIEPERVSALGLSYGTGLFASGVIPCLKHFPGHGSALSDSHKGFTDITQTWHRDELIPYRRLIAAGWPGAIMTAHVFHGLLDAEYPASISHRITTGLLRDELGWDGLVITDDLHMGAIVQRYTLRETIHLAIVAGADVLVFSNNSRETPYDAELSSKAHAILLELVESGEIPRERIVESWNRIARHKTMR